MQHPLIVTLLFTDVEGSTPLASLGDTFVEVVEEHRTILTGAAGARRGSGYPTGGDGCVFIFGSAGDAVAAAVEAQRALAAEPWPRVRPGPDGDSRGRDRRGGDELFVMALHQASRILAVAHGGQIVVVRARGDWQSDDGRLAMARNFMASWRCRRRTGQLEPTSFATRAACSPARPSR